MKYLIAAVLAISTSIAQASTITIDFEGPATVLSDSGGFQTLVVTQEFAIGAYTTGLFGPGTAELATGVNGTTVFSAVAETSWWAQRYRCPRPSGCSARRSGL